MQVLWCNSCYHCIYHIRYLHYFGDKHDIPLENRSTNTYKKGNQLSFGWGIIA